MDIRKVPFEALGGCFEQDDVDAAMKVIAGVADGGSFFPLPEESDFQQALAAHEGAERAVAVNSCGTALDVCMMALDIGQGDEVIVPGQTFVCTATCAAARGAKVVFADVDAGTMCLNARAVEKKITEKGQEVRTASAKTCVLCHTKDYDRMFSMWKTELGREVKKAQELERQALETLNKYKSSLTQDKLAEARKMFMEGREDFSIVQFGNGIHNAKYSQSLLDSAIGRFNDTIGFLEGKDITEGVVQEE